MTDSNSDELRKVRDRMFLTGRADMTIEPGPAAPVVRAEPEPLGFDVGARVWSAASGRRGTVTTGDDNMSRVDGRRWVRFDGDDADTSVKTSVLHPVNPKPQLHDEDTVTAHEWVRRKISRMDHKGTMRISVAHLADMVEEYDAAIDPSRLRVSPSSDTARSDTEEARDD